MATTNNPDASLNLVFSMLSVNLWKNEWDINIIDLCIVKNKKFTFLELKIFSYEGKRFDCNYIKENGKYRE